MTSISFYWCIPGEAGLAELPFPVTGFSLFERKLFGGEDGLGGPRVEALFRESRSEWVLWCHSRGQCRIAAADLNRMLELGAGADWIYGEALEGPALRRRVLADYQPGSVRDDFDFGPFSLIRVAAARAALERTGPLLESRWGGLYDLRLRMAETSLPLRLPEPLSVELTPDLRASGVRQFDYVGPGAVEYQAEMERIFTAHLERIGALLPRVTRRLEASATGSGGRCTASVVIPVRNREKTIGDALTSALSQKTTHDYNVLVVDNHSTDRTGEVIAAAAAKDDRVVCIVPERQDLGIGGCWNLAAHAPECGRYMVQLDSDDLYAERGALEAIVTTLTAGNYGMLVGAYKLVDFDLKELPPGVIDHREWTEANGPNNLLRVNGIGAPRAFATRLVQSCPFGNVSYGEDYGLALRITREYEVARLWSPLYLCRRWEDNSDADLDPAVTAAHHTYKDRLRTLEIGARQRMVAGG